MLVVWCVIEVYIILVNIFIVNEWYKIYKVYLAYEGIWEDRIKIILLFIYKCKKV